MFKGSVPGFVHSLYSWISSRAIRCSGSALSQHSLNALNNFNHFSQTACRDKPGSNGRNRCHWRGGRGRRNVVFTGHVWHCLSGIQSPVRSPALCQRRRTIHRVICSSSLPRCATVRWRTNDTSLSKSGTTRKSSYWNYADYSSVCLNSSNDSDSSEAVKQQSVLDKFDVIVTNYILLFLYFLSNVLVKFVWVVHVIEVFFQTTI